MDLTDAETTDAFAFWTEMSEPRTKGTPLLEAWRRFQAAERLRLARQVIRLGRLNAYQFHERQSRHGASGADLLHLPLTQDVLADILGLSAVHMNRTLQQLRRSGLVDYRAGRTALPDLAGLAQAAGLSTESSPASERTPKPEQVGELLRAGVFLRHRESPDPPHDIRRVAVRRRRPLCSRDA